MRSRRLTTALLSLLLSIVAFAAQKNLDKDITMVTYEQGWMDMNGTLSLKNNTGVEVKNVVFLITYLDMSGNELDYEEFNKLVSIAPGKTKKIDIPAYEQERFYHYYKSPGDETKPKTAFKIKFQLKDYNVEGEAEELNSSSLIRERNTNSLEGQDGFYLIIAISILLFFIGISIGLYVMVAVMAQKRNRNVVIWILLSLIATPLLMIIILLAIGENKDYNPQIRN